MKRILWIFFIPILSSWFTIGCECAKYVKEDVSTEQDSSAVIDSDTATARQAIQTPIPPKKKRIRPPERTLEAINEVVQAAKFKAKNCYRKIKRRDESLTGDVKIYFTINPAGEVIRVRFQQRNWSDSTLGIEVEQCLTDLIKTWRFTPIDESEENVTAPVSYIFN